MMKKDMLISIVGLQDHTETGKDKIEFITQGNLYQRNQKYYITYKESELTGYTDDTRTILKVDGDIITLIRSGSNNSQMVFEKGKKHLGHYETPYGSFTVGTTASDVTVNLDDVGGDVRIQYSLEINNIAQGRNDLTLTLREM